MRRTILAALALLFLFAGSAFGQTASISWNSSTAQDTAQTLKLSESGSVAISFSPAGTITGGVLTFEGSDDGGTNWYTISVFRAGAQTVDLGTFSLNGASKVLWRAATPGLSHIRVRLSTGITGTGTAHLRLTATDGVAVDGVIAGSSAAGTIDLTKIGGTAVVTGGVNGTLGVGGLAAHDAALAGNPGVVAGYSWTDGTNPTATTAGRVTRLLTTTDGRLVTTTDHPKRFSCTVVNSTATILTAFGGSCAAPGAGLSLYITDVMASASAAATTTTDQYLTLKSGTGGSCGTATAVVWASFNLANDPVAQSFSTPIKVAANSELCWMHAAAGNKTYVVNGYIAP